MLWLLVLVPLVAAAYLLVLRRRKQSSVRYAGLALLREAMGAGQRVRRHVPPVLFFVAFTLMIVAIARPAAIVTLPSAHETIVMAMDVSGSMRATDVKPSRLEAAQAAAKAFVEDQPSTTRIGVVSFAATASVVQPPTNSREDIVAAIDRFQLQRGTAVGSGILVSLKTIFPEAEFDLRSWNPRRDASKDKGKGKAPLTDKASDKTDDDKAKSVSPGSYASAAIILLTDGQTTTGPDPMEAAAMAAERGVRVYTVGVGTVAGEIIGAEGWSMRVRLDEDALKKIALITRGEYFFAGSAGELKKVYETLKSRMTLERKETEITALFAAAAAILALLSALLSLLWFNRIM
jgi:Ca-activated chloride channel family protein